LTPPTPQTLRRKWTRCIVSVVKKAKYDKNSVYVTCRRAVNHPSDPLKPRERGCFAYFHHKKSADQHHLWGLSHIGRWFTACHIYAKSSKQLRTSLVSCLYKPRLEMVFSPFLHAVGRGDAGNHAVRRGEGDRGYFYNYIANVTNNNNQFLLTPQIRWLKIRILC